MKPRTEMRTTKTKQAVEAVLTKHQQPLTLQEIYRKVKRQHNATAHSTVYRIVKKLESVGAVVKIDWKDRGGRFEWADRPHHHHLTCEQCDSTVDISDTTLHFNEKSVSKSTGFIIKRHSIELTGICAPCQETT